MLITLTGGPVILKHLKICMVFLFAIMIRKHYWHFVGEVRDTERPTVCRSALQTKNCTPQNANNTLVENNTLMYSWQGPFHRQITLHRKKSESEE